MRQSSGFHRGGEDSTVDKIPHLAFAGLAWIAYLRPPSPPQEVGISIPIFQRKKLRLRQVKSVPNRAGVCTQLLSLSKSAALAHVHCHVSDQQWGVEQGQMHRCAVYLMERHWGK